jgi:hypothetical protein
MAVEAVFLLEGKKLQATAFSKTTLLMAQVQLSTTFRMVKTHH